MKKYLPVLLLTTSAIALSACGSNKFTTKQEILSKRFEYNRAQVKDTVEEVPDWFTELPAEEGKLYSVGTGLTPDLQLSVDIAILNAKTTLADAINSRVKSQTKNFISKVGTDDIDSSTMTEITKATNNIVMDADVSGWQQKDLEIQAKGSQYRVFVLLEYSDTNASKILYNRLKKDRALLSKISASVAFKELEDSVSNQRKAETDRLRPLVPGAKAKVTSEPLR